MKKLLTFIALTVVSLSLLTSCGEQPEQNQPEQNQSAHTHSFSEWEVTENPTCTNNGISERFCDCGETQNKNIPALGHSIVIDETKEPTCASTGLTEGKHCSVCDTVTVAQQTIPEVAHTYDDRYDENCNECGFVRDADCAHAETETIKGYAATCTYAGLTDGTKCKKCGEILTPQVATNIVSHVEVIDQAIAATCTSTGLTEGKHCSLCKEILLAQSETAILEHTYTDDLDATCEVCGFTRKVECSHKNVTIQPAKDATCTEDGVTEGMVCDRCHLVLQPQIAISATGHTEVTDPATAATCTTAGLTEGKHCSTCNEIIVEQKRIAALGHNNSDWIVEKTPTETEDGYRYKTCYRCGSKTEEVVIPALSDIGLAYEINGSSVTITGIGSFSGTELTIPEYIKGYKVTAIGDKAFSECENLTKIVLPDTITTIGTRAFYGCTGITEITIPESVSSIGTQILYKASNLATVYYNGTYGSQENQFLNLSHITKIVFGGSYVPYDICYKNTAVQTVEILDSVKSINSYAFYGCTGITEIVIPNSVTSIGTYAFFNCSSLESVYITDIEAWCNISFNGSDSNPMYYVDNLYLNDKLVTKLILPDTITSIKDYAFYGCSSLTSVVIPDSVKSIGNRAFIGCSSLTSVVIPDSVTSIGGYAFSDCYSLTSVVIPDGVTSIRGSSFSYCSSLESVVIPDSVTSIGEWAFSDCSSLTSVVIPDSVTSIGSHAFSDCSSLTSVVIPDSVTSIDEYAFYRCSLTSVIIPDSVTNIGDAAFWGCDFTTITIPDSITSIGSNAFYECHQLVEVINHTSWNISIGSKDYGYVGYYALEVHKETTKIVNQDDYLFYTCNNVNYLIGYVGEEAILILPEKYNGENYEINKNAFYGCNSIISITIPDSVTAIGSDAFYLCRKLVEVINFSLLDIKAGSSNHGYVAYYAKEVHKEASKIVNYNDYLFYTYNDVNYLLGYIGNDIQIVLPEEYNNENYHIYRFAFYKCHDFTSITVSESVISIGDYAYGYCNAITDIYFNGTYNEWNAISKPTNWCFAVGKFILNCSDGCYQLFGSSQTGA